MKPEEHVWVKPVQRTGKGYDIVDSTPRKDKEDPPTSRLKGHMEKV